MVNEVILSGGIHQLVINCKDVLFRDMAFSRSHLALELQMGMV
jgi:hypothetical protein